MEQVGHHMAAFDYVSHRQEIASERPRRSIGLKVGAARGEQAPVLQGGSADADGHALRNVTEAVYLEGLYERRGYGPRSRWLQEYARVPLEARAWQRMAQSNPVARHEVLLPLFSWSREK